APGGSVSSTRISTAEGDPDSRNSEFHAHGNSVTPSGESPDGSRGFEDLCGDNSCPRVTLSENDTKSHTIGGSEEPGERTTRTAPADHVLHAMPPREDPESMRLRFLEWGRTKRACDPTHIGSVLGGPV